MNHAKFIIRQQVRGLWSAYFIATELDVRAMWVMRGKGKSFYEIGRIFKLDKSTVLRRLQALPLPKNIEIKEDWLKLYLTRFVDDQREDVSINDELNDIDE